MSTAGHVGVVVAYDGKTITTQEGNVSGAEWSRLTCSIEEFRTRYPSNLKFANPKNAPSFSGSSSSSVGNAKYVVKVATWKETATSFETNIPGEAPYSYVQYEMTEQSINYYDMVKAYTMPFNYLWDLLVLSEDRDFVLGLADLVYNSEIVVTVNDNLTTTQDITVHTCTDHKEISSYLTAVLEDGKQYSDSASNVENINYSSTKTVITQTNTLECALTKANVWIVDYSKNYKYEKGQASSSGSTTDLGNGEAEIEKNHSDPFGLASKVGKYQEISISTTSNSQIINNIQENTTITQSIKYVSDVPELKEKTEKVRLKNSEVGSDGFRYKEKNFVTLLVSNQKAKRNILNASSWLFEMLEMEENNLTDMVDLTKYLLYKATGVDYGITEFDFSIFDPETFTSVDGELCGGTTEEKIWYAVRQAGFNEYAAAGVLGNFAVESGVNSSTIQGDYLYSESDKEAYRKDYANKVDNGTISRSEFAHGGPGGGGYGLAQWTYYSLKEGLYDYAKSINASISDEDMQIEFLITGITGSGKATGYAAYALTIPRRGYTDSNFKNATSPEEAASAFCWLYENPGGDGHESMRRERAREYYEKFKGRSLDSFEGGQKGEMPTYYQDDYPKVAFGPYTIADAGCGPTSMAMVVSALTGNKITPIDACAWAEQKGYCVEGGLIHDYMTAAPAHYGIKCEYLGNNITSAVQALKSGKYVISLQTTGYFTEGAGHFIVLKSIDSKGKITIKDPSKKYHPDNNSKSFTQKDISEKGTKYWALYK